MPTLCLCVCVYIYIYIYIQTFPQANVFSSSFRTQLKLESLEDACVLDDEDDDSLVDKHGCPAYVSPEILTTMERYSGKAADMWSLGVILYTMLIGRYPFQDSDAGALFKKIRRGLYSITDAISSRAKCLIRSLLRMNPHDRLNASDVIHHPWFGLVRRSCSSLRMDISKDKDQLVPNFESHPSDFEFSQFASSCVEQNCFHDVVTSCQNIEVSNASLGHCSKQCINTDYRNSDCWTPISVICLQVENVIILNRFQLFY